MSRLSGSRIIPVVMLSAEYANGVDGGAINSGAWATRPINVKSVDTAAICTLSSDQFTLPPGDYRVSAQFNFTSVTYAAVRLYNVTDAAVILQGVNQYLNNGASNSAPVTLLGQFSLAATKTLRFENRSGANATNGRGLACGFAGAAEIYAQAKIEKVR